MSDSNDFSEWSEILSPSSWGTSRRVHPSPSPRSTSRSRRSPVLSQRKKTERRSLSPWKSDCASSSGERTKKRHSPCRTSPLTEIDPNSHIEKPQGAYDALLSRLIAHYKSLSASSYHGEIDLLQSLHGALDATNVSALSLLPNLPPDVKVFLSQEHTAKPPSARVQAAETQLLDVLSLLTPKKIDTLRGVDRPSDVLLRVAAAFLVLFSKLDCEIEVTPGQKVAKSRIWDTWQEYIKKPGRLIQTARKVIDFVKQGKVDSNALREVKQTLGSDYDSAAGFDCPWSECLDLLTLYLESVQAFHSAYFRSSRKPSKPRLSEVQSSPTLTPKSPKVVVKVSGPLYPAVCESLSPHSPKPMFKLSKGAIEWELEVLLQRHLQVVMLEKVTDFAVSAEEVMGESWASFGELWPALGSEIRVRRERWVAEVGESAVEEAVNEGKRKLRQREFLRKVVAKAIVRAKAEAARKCAIRT